MAHLDNTFFKLVPLDIKTIKVTSKLLKTDYSRRNTEYMQTWSSSSLPGPFFCGSSSPHFLGGLIRISGATLIWLLHLQSKSHVLKMALRFLLHLTPKNIFCF